MAQPFDDRAQRLTSDAFPVAETIATEGSRYGSFAVSDTGTLVYARGPSNASAHLAWYDRTGKMLGTIGDAGDYLHFALSPDERRVAVSLLTGSPANRDVWVIDVARGVGSRLTFDPADEAFPVWSPDSARIVYQSVSAGKTGLRIKSADGSGTDEPLLSLAPTSVPFTDDWSADGRFIVYGAPPNVGTGAMDLWILPMSGDHKPFPIVQAPGLQNRAVISPDSRWLAYTSDESGTPQVTFSRLPFREGASRSRRTAAHNPSGDATARNFFF
jgi:eukaryotic-like serine/threonine-protein kinase